MDTPDTITIETQARARIEAERADFYISVAGSALFSGTSALKKAREVAELVALLKGCGVEETQIHVESVRVESASGTFSKSSSAHYGLRVENIPLARIADAVGAVAGAPGATLNRIEWKFAPEKPLRDKLREQCLDEALERARNVANKLSLKLIGVYEMREDWQGTQPQGEARLGRTLDRNRVVTGGSISEAELGLAVSHAEEVAMSLTLQFRVSEFV